MNLSPRRRTVLAVVIALAIAVPGTALATHSFTDVDDGAYYASAVDWALTNGVTSGCNPGGGNTRFCPNDNVTRGQMAVFLNNLDSKNVFLTPDEKAADADKLDGLNSSAFLRTTGKAADANKLDGLDSTDLLPRFAVTKSALVIASRGVLDYDHEATGLFAFQFDRDVSDCAFQATPGGRFNGIFGDSYFVFAAAHSHTRGPDWVRVQIVRENDTGDLAEYNSDFNLSVHC